MKLCTFLFLLLSLFISGNSIASDKYKFSRWTYYPDKDYIVVWNDDRRGGFLNAQLTVHLGKLEARDLDAIELSLILNLRDSDKRTVISDVLEVNDTWIKVNCSKNQRTNNLAVVVHPATKEGLEFFLSQLKKGYNNSLEDNKLLLARHDLNISVLMSDAAEYKLKFRTHQFVEAIEGAHQRHLDEIERKKKQENDKKQKIIKLRDSAI